MCKLASEYINQNIKIIDYFETLSSTKKIEKAIWSNYILQKI